MIGSATRATAIGGALGLAWATSFRAWMTHLNVDFFNAWPSYTWKGTFLSVLVPPLVVGALVGYDWHRRSHGKPRLPLAVWSPLLMILGPALVAEDFIGTLLDTGMGGGAIGIVLIGMCGGFAISGRGPSWLRGLIGVLFVGITGIMVIGFYFWDRALSASGSFGATYLTVLLVALSIGCSVSMRRVTADQPTLWRVRDESSIAATTDHELR